MTGRISRRVALAQLAFALGQAHAARARRYRVVPGTFVVVGKQPDGDSVRFVPDRAGAFERLEGSRGVRVSSDGSVQLRLEGVDAPELHHRGAAQPGGAAARDALLGAVGFAPERLRYGRDQMTVASAAPTSVPGVVLTRAADPNGRPIVYLLARGAPTASTRELDEAALTELLPRTINHQLLARGDAYPAIHSTMPEAHARLARTAATGARTARLGVWRADRSARFQLRTVADLAPPDGALVYPKLFRRAVDYLAARARPADAGGWGGTFPAWIAAHTEGRRPQNDVVWLSGRRVRLADLIEQDGDQVTFDVDLVALTFGAD